MSDGCAAECERLAMLGAALDDDARVMNWRRTLHDLARAPDLETLAGEGRLDDLTLELRRLLLARAHACADRHMKSPPHDEAARLPSGERVEFTYERNLRAGTLEARLANYRPRSDGWDSAHIGFRSGMAALSCWLVCRVRMIQPGAERPHRLAMRGGYFETHVLLELLRTPGFEPTLTASQQAIEAAVREGTTDDVLIEPVVYDWELETFDLAALLRAWRDAPQPPRALVVDATVVGLSFPLEQLLDGLRARPPEIVVVVQSGLKLEQQGLELANVGLLSLYTPRGIETSATAQETAVLLRKMRTILGTAPSLDALAALDTPFVLDPALCATYQQAVFRNNALLAHALSERAGKLFGRIVHPSLSGVAQRPWARAPFVIGHLAEDTLETHGLLLAVIALTASARNVPLVMGSSFGFRHSRAETIVPSITEGRGLFKVAMGARAGPARTAVIKLLCELAEYSDTDALRRAYPQARPVTFEHLMP